jgi:predicted Ser/Thr protein kinase
MNDKTTPRCPQCGAPLKESAPAGLCPHCLMALNLQTETVFTDDTPGAPPPLPPEQIAPHFPQLEILECLGRGGMGVVYQARQKSLNRLVALKLLAPERVGDAKFAGRFAREAQALAALNHPNIVTIYDFGQAGGFYYLLMEFVDGVNLRQLLRARKFTPEEALAIVPPLCDALQFAHDRGIVHRDIKPENLLLDKTGRVKVADFGLAKMIEPEPGRADLPAGPNVGAAPQPGPSGIMGTPSYSAPEQKTDPQRVDRRADIYSLGVVFYEMLTGELPGRRIEPPSRKVQIDVRLDEVVLRALESRPELRFQQVSEVKTAVETIAGTPANPSAPAVRNAWINQGLNYRSKATLFGLPLLHVTAGIDPQTGRARVAKGIIAVGGLAKGVVAFGGVAMGGFAFGGLACGVVAFGGAALGLVSFGGLAIALIAALGGGAIAPVAIGGGAVGYWAFGGGAMGVHVFDAMTKDPVAGRFFLPWAQVLIENAPWLNVVILTFVLGVGVGVPLWLQRRFVYSTAWAKERGRDADQIKLLSVSRKNLWRVLFVVGVAALLVLAQFRVFTRSGGISELTARWKGDAARTKERSVGRPAQADKSTITLRPVMERTIPAGGPFVARFPGGMLELIAVRPFPDEGEPWAPDGGISSTPLKIAARDKNNPPYSSDVGSNQIRRQFLVKGTFPLGAGIVFPLANFGLEGDVAESDASPQRWVGCAAICQAVPRAAAETDVSLWVGVGPWETVAVQKTGLLGGFGSDRGRGHWKWSANPDGSILLEVGQLTSKPASDERRFVAVDEQGVEHASWRSEETTVSTETVSRIEAVFGGAAAPMATERGLTLAQVKAFRLQIRRGTFVQFRHVSLRPGHSTTVEIRDGAGGKETRAEAHHAG